MGFVSGHPLWASSGYDELETDPHLCLMSSRIRAHEVFDKLWNTKKTRHEQCAARTRAYAWLAAMMGLDSDECHIKLFDEERCREAIEICEKHFCEMEGNA